MCIVEIAIQRVISRSVALASPGVLLEMKISGTHSALLLITSPGDLYEIAIEDAVFSRQLKNHYILYIHEELNYIKNQGPKHDSFSQDS